MSTTWFSRGLGVVAALLWSAIAGANPLIVVNQSAGGNTTPNNPIQTFDFATGALVNQFVPDGAAAGVGEAVAVLGNNIYYTEGTCPAEDHDKDEHHHHKD